MSLSGSPRPPLAGFADGSGKTAIVFVAFGTSDPAGLRVLEEIDRQAKDRYPQMEVFWAFRSDRTIGKQAITGTPVRGLDETVAGLVRSGYRSAVFQNLSVAAPAVETLAPCGMKVEISAPLLNSSEDVERVASILAAEVDPQIPTVVVAHGSAVPGSADRLLVELSERLENLSPRLVVASLKGSPGTAPLEKIRAQVASVGLVRFIPLTVVAGSHIRNDVLGELPGSWKNLLGAERCECSPSLGEREAILSVYFDHLDQALGRLAEARKRG